MLPSTTDPCPPSVVSGARPPTKSFLIFGFWFCGMDRLASICRPTQSVMRQRIMHKNVHGHQAYYGCTCRPSKTCVSSQMRAAVSSSLRVRKPNPRGLLVYLSLMMTCPRNTTVQTVMNTALSCLFGSARPSGGQ